MRTQVPPVWPRFKIPNRRWLTCPCGITYIKTAPAHCDGCNEPLHPRQVSA